MNYRTILATAQHATCVDWFRDSQTLTIITDDLPNDRRSILTVRVKHATWAIRTLKGYDAAKRRWGEYCEPACEARLANQQGKKALMNWLRSKAVEKCEWIPNPVILNINNNVTV